MIPKRTGECARNLARNPRCGSRIRPERGIGRSKESERHSKSGLGITIAAPAKTLNRKGITESTKAHATAVAKKDSEASLKARLGIWARAEVVARNVPKGEL